MLAKAREEGSWEYATLPHCSYHISKRRLDFARRRRWIRKLIAIDASKPPIFHFKGKEEVCVLEVWGKKVHTYMYELPNSLAILLDTIFHCSSPTIS